MSGVEEELKGTDGFPNDDGGKRDTCVTREYLYLHWSYLNYLVLQGRGNGRLVKHDFQTESRDKTRMKNGECGVFCIGAQQRAQQTGFGAGG